MKRKQLDFSELYDVRAVRILVDDIKDCYAALSGWCMICGSPFRSEFDDYIAHPKSNNYRSLHTAVIGPRELALEVQIRTQKMHQHSELGVAAHWRYKEGGKSDAGFDEKIAWLRQILEWKDELTDSGDMLEQFKNELFQDQVYVLTPQGKVIDLPKGATPVDFAYVVHTDLGHRTRGAKVDGSIVPLNYKLQNGQRVEILTAKQGSPSRDWLNPTLGYLQSPRARAKVRHWFKQQNIDESVAAGPGATGSRTASVRRRRHQSGKNRTEITLQQTGRSARGIGSRRHHAAPCQPVHSAGNSCSRATQCRGSINPRAKRESPDRRRKQSDDPYGEVLQARSTARHRRLRHARPGHHHPHQGLFVHATCTGRQAGSAA